jgi:hypothetical protein
MNDRIRELILKSTETVDVYNPDTGITHYREFFDKEKFAELIVRECANRASWAQDTNEADIGGEVLKHFGVEE